MNILNTLIKNNLSTIRSNIFAGIGGLILYPSVHLTTPLPIGPYALVCYSTHHLHITASLRNIALLANHQGKIQPTKKYINYNLLNGNYSFDEHIKSIYFANINHITFTNKNTFWYTKVIKQASLPFEIQYIINQLVNIRDRMTKTIIGSNIISGYVLYNLDLVPYINNFLIVANCMIIPFAYNSISELNDVYKIISEDIISDKKYFYINTFGDIVPTNYKYGLYTRHEIIK